MIFYSEDGDYISCQSNVVTSDNSHNEKLSNYLVFSGQGTLLKWNDTKDIKRLRRRK